MENEFTSLGKGKTMNKTDLNFVAQYLTAASCPDDILRLVVRTLILGLREEEAPPNRSLAAIVEEIVGAAEVAQTRFLN